MSTLAFTLGCTAPVSPLLRKARRLGIGNLDQILALAVARGCRHYAACVPVQAIEDPGMEKLPDDELTILLLLGEHPYNPTAVRCAAQLARSRLIKPARLLFLAKCEKVERVLAHIARAGADHDPPGADYWQVVLDGISNQKSRQEPHLPHWSRFVSMPGLQRLGAVEPRWLVPQ